MVSLSQTNPPVSRIMQPAGFLTKNSVVVSLGNNFPPPAPTALVPFETNISTLHTKQLLR